MSEKQLTDFEKQVNELAAAERITRAAAADRLRLAELLAEQSEQDTELDQ